jgi:hypothetical protein
MESPETKESGKVYMLGENDQQDLQKNQDLRTIFCKKIWLTMVQDIPLIL